MVDALRQAEALQGMFGGYLCWPIRRKYSSTLIFRMAEEVGERAIGFVLWFEMLVSAKGSALTRPQMERNGPTTAAGKVETPESHPLVQRRMSSRPQRRFHPSAHSTTPTTSRHRYDGTAAALHLCFAFPPNTLTQPPNMVSMRRARSETGAAFLRRGMEWSC